MIGVFLSFTLSQTGMFLRTTPHARAGLAVQRRASAGSARC